MSLLLFALTIEPLAALIRSHSGVRGFKRGTIEEKVALYTDDLLLFLEDALAAKMRQQRLLKPLGCTRASLLIGTSQ